MNRFKIGKISLKILSIPLAVSGVWFFVTQYAESRLVPSDFAALILSMYLGYCVYTIGFRETKPKIKGFFAPTLIYLGLYFIAAVKYYVSNGRVGEAGFSFALVGLLALAGTATCILKTEHSDIS